MVPLRQRQLWLSSATSGRIYVYTYMCMYMYMYMYMYVYVKMYVCSLHMHDQRTHEHAQTVHALRTRVHAHTQSTCTQTLHAYAQTCKLCVYLLRAVTRLVLDPAGRGGLGAGDPLDGVGDGGANLRVATSTRQREPTLGKWARPFAMGQGHWMG